MKTSPSSAQHSGTRPALGVGVASKRRAAVKAARTHCNRGHEYAVVGRYPKCGGCKQCKADNHAMRQKSITPPWRKRGRRKSRKKSVPQYDMQLAQASSTNRILELYDAQERAATHWERAEIQLDIDAELARQ